MAKFRVTASDGLVYILEGPEDATRQELEQALNDHLFGAPAAQDQTPVAPEQQTGSTNPLVRGIVKAGSVVQSMYPGPLSLLSPEDPTRKLVKNVVGEVRKDPEHAFEAAGRAAEKELLPTTVGVGTAGLTSRAVAPLAGKLIGRGLEQAPHPVAKAAGYALEYGAPLASAVLAGRGTQLAQEKGLEAAPQVAEAVGLEPEKMQALQQQYPTMTTLGGIAPGFAFFKPPVKELQELRKLGQSMPGLAEQTAGMQQNLIRNAGVMGALQSGLNLGEQLWTSGGDFSKVDMGQVGIAGATGLLQSSPTKFGTAMGMGARPRTEEAPTTQPETAPAGAPRIEGPSEEIGAPPRGPEPSTPPGAGTDVELMEILGMKPKAVAPVAPTNQPHFTTASGSAYYLNDEGTGTVRQQSPKEMEEGKGITHFETQPESTRTVYMSEQSRNALAPWSTGNFDVRFNPKKQEAYLVYNNGPRQGEIATGTTVPYETEPKIGLYPVEHYGTDGYEQDYLHFGHIINQVNPRQPKPVEAPKAETPPVEAPKAETPPVETPPVEAPRFFAPEGEAPKELTPQERIKDIEQRILAFAEKRGGGLTKKEADEVIRLTGERAELLHPLNRRATEETLSKTTPETRKSTLDLDSMVTISGDVHQSLPIFKLIEQHSMGHGYGDTPIDTIMRGKDKNMSAQELYDAFTNTRNALRGQFGNKITLYRAESERQGTPVNNWATTPEFAEQFGGNVISREVPIDDIVAANVNRNGKYHELIVGNRDNGAKLPVRTITALPKRNTLTPDAKEDSILQFLAKHPRGISKEEAAKQGVDPESFKIFTDNPASVGIRNAFKKNGMSFDEAAELLSQHGYPVTDENGNYNPNTLLDQIDKELRGTPVHSHENTRWAQEQEFDDLTRRYPDAKVVKPKEVKKPKGEPKPKKVAAKIAPAKTIGEAVTDAADDLVQNGGTAADAVSTAIADTNLGIVKETIAAKPGMDIERMASMLGPQLYGDQTQQTYVTIKELLQNSFDAVKGLLDKGTVLKGRINIRYDASDRSVSLIDNGSGMTPDILATKFLEIAGTHKESDAASGGFGIAKMLTLYANNDVHVTTMRNGKVAVLDTTGKQLLGALSSTNPQPPPSIEVRTPTEADREKFPEGHGTHVRITVPTSFRNTSTGEDSDINFPAWWQGVPEAIRRSPLFADIDVTVNDKPVEGVGSAFPANDFLQFAKVEYPWGTARIYVSKNPRPETEAGANTYFLSNGLFQYSASLLKNPLEIYGEKIPYTFYVDLRPNVKPGESGYPFTFNRKALTPEANSDLNKVLNYINKQYSYKSLGDEAQSFGGIQYFDSRGKLGKVEKIEPKIAAPKSKFDAIHAGANVEVKNGIIYVDGKEIPALTPEELKADIPDSGKLTVSQDDIDPNRVMVHDNLTIETANGPVEASQYMRDKFGDRYDKYIHGLGKQFMALRDLVSDVMDYPALRKEGIGISIDEEYRGVSIRVPFSAAFLNPLIPESSNPAEAGYGFVGTMVHEFAHHKERSHNANFPAEMQRIEYKLQAKKGEEYDTLKKAVVDLVKNNSDIIEEGQRIYKRESIKPSRKRLQDSAELIRPQGRDERVSEGDRERSGAIGTGERVLPSNQGSRETTGRGREAGYGSAGNEEAGSLEPQYQRRLRPEGEPPEPAPGSAAERMQQAEEDIRQRARAVSADANSDTVKSRVQKFYNNLDDWADKLIYNGQDVFIYSKNIQTGMELRPGKHLIISGPDANDLYMRLATMDTRKTDIMTRDVYPLVDKATAVVRDLAGAKNTSADVVVQMFGDYLVARHAPVRRNIFFMLYRPLSENVVPGAAGSETGYAPYKVRQKLMAQAAKVIGDKKLSNDDKRTALSRIADQIYRIASDNRNADPLGVSPQREARGYVGANSQPLPMPTNWSAELYAPAEGTSPSKLEPIEMLMNRDLADPVVGPMLRKLFDIHDKEMVPLYRDLNKQSGSWADNTDLIVDGFYRFGDTYTPLKGKAGDLDPLNLEGTRNTGDIAGLVQGMEGGRHSVENPFLQMVADLDRAARKASREGVTLRVKNLIDQKYLDGEHVATIPASEQFFNNDILKAYPAAKSSNSVFHKLPNGDIEVYHVKNEGVLNGLRRPFDDVSLVTKIFQSMTNPIAMMHTRYKMTFYPLNFVKDASAIASLLPTMYTKEIGKFAYPAEVLKNALTGNGFKGVMYAKYYHTNIAKLRDIAKRDPYARSVLEYLTEGGPALYGKAIDIERAYDRFAKLSKNPVLRGLHQGKDAFDAGLDYWGKSWDFLGRVSAYDLIKKIEYPKIYDREIEAGKSPTEAHVIANSESTKIGVYRTKSLSNLSLYGAWRALPAMYMFARAASTTVARTGEALAPLFRSPESQLAHYLPPEALANPEEVAYAKEQLKKRKKNLSFWLAQLFGAGMAFYAFNYMLGMMLPGDEQGRNRVGYDDKKQSVRGFRIPFPTDKQRYLNVPIFEFNLSSIMGLGYQTAAFLNPGDVQFMDIKGYTGNLARIVSSVVSPIQPSGISPIDNPLQFVMDTILPTAGKTVYELSANMDSIGNKIYNDTAGRISEVYTGGTHVPQIFKDGADFFYKYFNTEISPNAIRYLATNYADGVTEMANMGNEVIRGILKGLSAAGGKTPELKAFFGSFVGNRAPVDSGNWSKIDQKLKDIKEEIGTAAATNDPDLIVRSAKKNAGMEAAIAAFNVNLGTIRKLQEEMKSLRANKALPLDLKSQILSIKEDQLNLEKRLAVERVKPYGIKP